MNTYVINILTAAAAFPLIAAVITLPYMIYQYRHYGSIPWIRTIVLYSFVFYVLCAYFLVLLPLPADHHAVVAYAAIPQLIPFHFVDQIIQTTSISPSSPASWIRALQNPVIYEALFNILLLVPLGMYLRYYFRRRWWHTLLIGGALTLSFELTQLTGLWGLYDHPYRLFDVDDLITNTFGAMVGFWMVGPMMRALPDVRLVNEQARLAGLHAGMIRRALAFALDAMGVGIVSAVCLTLLLSLPLISPFQQAGIGIRGIGALVTLLVGLIWFCLIPLISRGQTPAQKLIKLQIVLPNASTPSWYHYLARYVLLCIEILLPLSILNYLVSVGFAANLPTTALSLFIVRFRGFFIVAWIAIIACWAISFIGRSFRAKNAAKPLVMLYELLSTTRIMTKDGAAIERERRSALSVDEVIALEQSLVAKGTPLSVLMERAGKAVAQAICEWVPDPARVVVLAGSGNNGGDGWVCALELARLGYPITLITRCPASDLVTEPAHTTACKICAQISQEALPVRILVEPGQAESMEAIDTAQVIVDALLGTGFCGTDVKQPYAQWIDTANRRRFQGPHRPEHQRRKTLCANQTKTASRRMGAHKVKKAPFAVAIDTPSGFSAQNAEVALPCFAADLTVTMLAYKPGLLDRLAYRWAGHIILAPLD